MGPRRHPSDLVSYILSERLQGCEASAGLRALVCAPGLDWERVISYASAQLILPAFAAALRDLDLIGSLDAELGAFLEAVHAANLERNSQLGDELAAAVAVLNQAEIEPVLLKGAIRLTDGIYPDRGWRMLRDLDLLVPKERWKDAIRSFERAGYVPRRAANKEVPLRRPGGCVDIDLHRELFSTSRRERLLRAEEVLDDSRRIMFRDASVRLPSMAHQIVHLIGHRQLQDHNHAYGRTAWRDWFEVAALEHWGRQGIDWPAVFARFAAAGYRAPLLTFLLSLKTYALCAVPVPSRIGPLISLHQRRLRWQARSALFEQISLWAVWCISELREQVEERDAGQPRAFKNLKRLVLERGAVWRMARALADRQRQLLHVLPHLSWFVA